jgi:hypothetical protein
MCGFRSNPVEGTGIPSVAFWLVRQRSASATCPSPISAEEPTSGRNALAPSIPNCVVSVVSKPQSGGQALGRWPTGPRHPVARHSIEQPIQLGS